MRLVVVLWFALCAAAFAAAGEAVHPTTSQLVISPPARDLQIIVGKSVVLDFPAGIRQISSSDPAVVEAVPASATEFMLNGKGYGVSTVVVWAKSGGRAVFNIAVDHNLEPIRKLIAETFPDEKISVYPLKDSVALTGRVSAKDVADRAVLIATPLAKSVVNNMQAAPPPVARQILLRVKFAEINRSVGQQFGINLISTGSGNTIGRATTGQFAPPGLTTVQGGIPGRSEGASASFNIADALNIFAFRPDLNLAAFVRLLQQQGLLQILAEPNLVTTNGKEASFLAGGEFPVPVAQGGANVGAVTIQFREFGVRLTFNPTITENGTIRLYVKPEVSTIDLANAVSFGGYTIPALSTRRVETNIELAEGQSFVIGGLMDDRVTENLSRIPGLANIPVLGTLFKSRSENRTKTELVVLVTPEIAQPLDAGQPLPVPQMQKDFMPSVPVPSQPGPSSKNRGKAHKKPTASAPPLTNWRRGFSVEGQYRESAASAAAGAAQN